MIKKVSRIPGRGLLAQIKQMREILDRIGNVEGDGVGIATEQRAGGVMLRLLEGGLPLVFEPKYVENTENTSTGSWAVPDGIALAIVSAVSGGGGGGGGDTGTAVDQSTDSGGHTTDWFGGAGGGGGGGGTLLWIVRVTPGQEFQYTIGSGGAGGTTGTSPTDGSVGGNTTITFMGDVREPTVELFGGGNGDKASNSDGGSGGQGGNLLPSGSFQVVPKTDPIFANLYKEFDGEAGNHGGDGTPHGKTQRGGRAGGTFWHRSPRPAGVNSWLAADMPGVGGGGGFPGTPAPNGVTGEDGSVWFIGM